MLTNCPNSSSDTTRQSNSSVITELPFSICFIQRPSSLLYFVCFVTCILILLPICSLVLWIGLKRWQQQRSTSVEAKMSHSDCFTYHLVVMELIGVSGLVLCCCDVFTLHVKTYLAGVCIYSVVWYGEWFFHILTCVERFLAVVHPITYVSLKSEKGVKIRKMCVGVVWLLSVGQAGVSTSKHIAYQWALFVVAFTLVVISLCSFSVLYVLIRPRPGEQGADREKIDQSKKRAFFTIVILGMLFLKCAWSLIWVSILIVRANHCLITSIGVWLNIPSILVLPVMFLQRAGLFTCSSNVK